MLYSNHNTFKRLTRLLVGEVGRFLEKWPIPPNPKNLVVPRARLSWREGWDQTMFGQLETEQEAEEGAALATR